MLPHRFWHETTTRDFADSDTSAWIAVLPVAAIEQHGPHLPVYTDTCIAEGMVARVIELLTERQLTELHVLYSPPTDADAFRDAILAHLPGPAPTVVTTQLIGPVIGAHIGPGAYGAIMVREIE